MADDIPYSDSQTEHVCAHNERENVSLNDLLEHALNSELGSLARDFSEIVSGEQNFSFENNSSSNQNHSDEKGNERG